LASWWVVIRTPDTTWTTVSQRGSHNEQHSQPKTAAHRLLCMG
jgi:hypothetical protein